MRFGAGGGELFAGGGVCGCDLGPRVDRAAPGFLAALLATNGAEALSATPPCAATTSSSRRTNRPGQSPGRPLPLRARPAPADEQAPAAFDLDHAPSRLRSRRPLRQPARGQARSPPISKNVATSSTGIPLVFQTPFSYPKARKAQQFGDAPPRINSRAALEEYLRRLWLKQNRRAAGVPANVRPAARFRPTQISVSPTTSPSLMCGLFAPGHQGA